MTVFSLLLGLAGRPIRFAGDLADAVLEGLSGAERYQRLSNMTQDELTRIGLTRGDTPRAAVEGFAAPHRS
jgi:uncharacterized protein YjiS (DUF1127 family)